MQAATRSPCAPSCSKYSTIAPSLPGRPSRSSQWASFSACSGGSGRRSRPSLSPCRALWDESMTLADLRKQLDMAVKAEDYELAAQIKDSIQQKGMDHKLAVEAANDAFYDAFRSGNAKEMEALWGHGDHVQIIHPGSACIAGRDEVMESWRAILKGVRPRAFRISLDDVRVYATEAHAFVTCVEVIEADDSKGRTVATNIFEKQGGRWVVVLHQGGPIIKFSR